MTDCVATPRPSPRPKMLWCSNRSRSRRGDGWCFPGPVEREIRKECRGAVLHLFGGRAAFGTRIDVDRMLRPDVVADAWLPPFGKNSFGTVVLDPPYTRINAQEADALLRSAAMVARHRVIWLHTVWMSKRSYLRPLRSWLIRVGDLHQCRCLQVFQPIKSHPKLTWPRYFKRGPALKYNRWLAGAQRLPFPEEAKQ